MTKPTYRIFIERNRYGARMMCVDLTNWYLLGVRRPVRMSGMELIESVDRKIIPRPIFKHVSKKFKPQFFL